ncbi:MAG: hypothetical protein ACKVQC_01740 [Elusimicrobiota bacterium]
MKEEWDDKEREPLRMVQYFDAEAQKNYKDWSVALKFEWLSSILKLYWSGRAHQNKTSPKI